MLYNQLLDNSTQNVEIKKHKRAQVKVACVNCKASCKKCDEFRPCRRCKDRGMESHCIDAKRKPREKGTTRGHYRKYWMKQNLSIPTFSELLSTLKIEPRQDSNFLSQTKSSSPVTSSPDSSSSHFNSFQFYNQSIQPYPKLPSIHTLLKLESPYLPFILKR